MPRPTFTDDELTDDRPARFAEARVVRFQDVDAAGIVFYPRVLEYFSDAYMAFFMARGYDMPREVERRTFAAPLIHAEADYLLPLRFGDAVSVEVVGAKVGGSSFTVGYRVRAPGGRFAAIGRTVHVSIDRGTFKARAIPEAVRGILEG
jgi:1,4-dihydroxy-2-naphthoyl-CoA hydrolase